MRNNNNYKQLFKLLIGFAAVISLAAFLFFGIKGSFKFQVTEVVSASADDIYKLVDNTALRPQWMHWKLEDQLLADEATNTQPRTTWTVGTKDKIRWESDIHGEGVFIKTESIPNKSITFTKEMKKGFPIDVIEKWELRPLSNGNTEITIYIEGKAMKLLANRMELEMGSDYVNMLYALNEHFRK